MEDLSLHILDIAENSIGAGAHHIDIDVCEDAVRDLLCIEITDDGKGMSANVAQKAADPFYTTRTTRKVGLGLALLQEATAMANGAMDISSVPDKGTTIRATFQLSHVDRKPLGNMAETIMALIATPAEVDIRYTHTRDGRTAALDTQQIRKQLGDIPLMCIEVMSFIREYLNQEENSLAQ